MNLTPSDLLTVAGAAAATLLVIQLIVKPALKARPVSEAVYPLVINIASIVIAGIFVVLGMFAFGNISNMAIVQGVLTTLFAAASVIGISTVSSNTQRYMLSRRKK